MSSVATIGHNSPPGPIDDAEVMAADLNEWLAEHPVIQTEEDAKAAGLEIERARIVLGSMEDARKKEVQPLNDAVTAINGRYRVPRETLKALCDQAKVRLNLYVLKKEDAKRAEAEAKRREAEEAERLAREAEAKAQEAIENAKAGECVDLAGALVGVATAGAEAGRADRAAAIAERDVGVRIPSQLGGRALSLKTREVLIVDDIYAAIESMLGGPSTEKITDAVLSAARDYRKANGVLPNGIHAEFERSI